MRARVRGLRADSAMGAFDAGLEALVAAVGAWDKVALWPREQIDNEAEDIEAKDEEHPEDGAVHAAGLGIAGDPDEEGDAEGQAGNGKENKGAAAACG